MKAPGEGRRLLLAILGEALRAVNGREVVARRLRRAPLPGPVRAVAVGKAAAAMTAGALDALGERLQAALVITKYGHLVPSLDGDPRVRCLEAGHPVPDAASLRAGEALLDFVHAIPRGDRVLFLISGGTSSLVEAPVAGVDLDTLQRVNRWLLASGLDIHQINAVRKRLSRIKGGRLLTALTGLAVEALLISDVRGDDPAVIGSGMLVPGEALDPLDLPLPDWLRSLLAGLPAPPAAPRHEVHIEVVANLDQALEAAVGAARARGLEAVRHPEFLDGDAVAAGRRLGAQVAAARPGLQAWGGETTVVLPPHPGRGGRNQSLALAAATRLDGHSGAWLLAVGTDGTDGPTGDAGALVDGGTVARGRARGLDPETALAAADAGSFLAVSGDLVRTGPTGTNVMDLVLGLRLGGEGPE